MATVYKIVNEDLWRAAEASGVFAGSPVDHDHGFIHLSIAEQVPETVAKHFVGQSKLMLVAIDADALGDALRWEPARGGVLFPHLYGQLDLAAVVWAKPLREGPDGTRVYPDMD